MDELVSYGMRTNADNSAMKNTRYKASEVAHRAGLEDGDLVAFVADEVRGCPTEELSALI